jgi:hypothetical protein
LLFPFVARLFSIPLLFVISFVLLYSVFFVSLPFYYQLLYSLLSILCIFTLFSSIFCSSMLYSPSFPCSSSYLLSYDLFL